MKEGLPFAWDISLKKSEDSYICFRLVLLHSVSYFFYLHRSPLLLCTVFYSISSNMDRFSRSTHLLMCLFFETLTSIITTDSPILVELIDLVNSVVMFLSQMTLLRCLTFLVQSLTVTHTVLLLDLFISSDASICSTIASPPLGNAFVSVFIDFPINSNCTLHFIAYLMTMTILVLIGMVFVII